MEIDFEEAQNWLSKYKMLKLKELIILNSVHRPDLLYPFLYKMPNLEKLKLTSSSSESLETLRSTNNGQHDRLGVVLQLKQLFICSSDISDLGFERDQVLERLELLRLKGCYNLSNLCPSSVSLSYLTCLKLKRCHRLKDLVASSTAKTMVQLKTMKVINCRQVEQIVSNHRSEEGKGIKIVFSKLISIELVGLMNMTSFCGYKNCEFEFPLLEILIVRECPKMKKFSERESIAPKLKDIFRVEGDKKAKWQWEGDLNATIQKVFDDKLSFAYTEDLRLSDDTQLWQASRSVQQNSFRYLKRLTVEGCHSVVHVIPSHLLSCFHNLEELHVSRCKAAEVIFNINDENRVTKPSGIFRLKKLYLNNLRKLEHVWEKDPEGIMGLQALEIMYVYGCGRLKSLFPASLATTDLTRLRLLHVCGCEELREIFRKDEKVGEGEDGTTQHSAFPPLTSLTLYKLPSLKYSIHRSKQQESTSNLSEGDIQEICLGSRSIPNSYFGLLESLTLDGCEFLTDVLLPFNLLPFLTNLEKLEVRNFDSVKIIFDVKCTTQEREVASMGQTLPFSLKKLVVSKLPNLENVWNDNPYGILTLHHLQELYVEDCKDLTSVFPPSVAKDGVEHENQVVEDVLLPFSLLPFLTNLETLKVRNCDSVKAIFDVKCTTQGRDVTYMGQTLPFSLKKLIVSKLPNLKNVWNEDPQVILSMHHLQEVCVEECEGLTSVFPASKDKYLLKLKNVVVKDCKGLMTIFADDNIDPRTKLELTCPFVRSLELEGLPNFKYFYYSSLYCDIFTDLESHNENKVGSEKLLKCLSMGENGVNMILKGEFEPNLLDNIKALTLCLGSDLFGYGILEGFPNIEKLVVCDGSFKEMFCCESGNNVLQKLKVLQLESLRELVSIGLENSWTDSFVRNLESFEVISCESLENLVACKKGVSFSNLTCLKVEGCYSLSYLLTSSTAKSLGQLKRMKIKSCYSIEEIVCKEESDGDEIIFPKLSCLNLEWLSELKSFYKGSLSFPSLEELTVSSCSEMITLCPGTLKAGKLSQVKLDNSSEAVQLEIDLNSTMREKYMRKRAPSQWELEFRDRADLQEIWRVALQIKDFCFRYLKKLIVNECKISSDAVLPFTLLPLLPKLETLEVRNCDSVKTIFDVKCITQDTSITFPLKTLVLWKLPKLETLWNEDTDGNPGHPEGTNPNLTFPTLTSLTLWDLPNFNHNIHDATPTSELIIPNLEDLTVGKNELKMIVDGEFQTNLLHYLKVLGLCFDNECDEFPEYGFLQQLPNVKKLMVWSSSFKLIFCHQRPNNSELLLQLKELRLESLGELVSIGLENSWTEPFVRNLETFEVISCSTLENLVTCTVSFSNLICLKVQNCDGLSYLFTSSTAKTLAQLKRIEIENCESIEEIVCGEESDDEEDEIIFPQLSCLKLYRLLNLRRFYRGNLSFPSLEELSVTYCDDMVTLCPSTLKADKLTQVRIDYKNIPLDTDLNSTTRKGFGRKISELEDLDLKSRPKLPELWHDPLYIPDLYFSKLVIMTVEVCQFLSDAVLPFHLLPLLPKLETLEVGNCDYVKTIFDLKRTTKDTVVTLPLKKLSLSNLSNLENIWSEDPHGILIMHHLKEVHVKECKGLTSVFPTSVTKDLVVDECEGLKAIVAEESKEDEIIFPQLMYLELESCNSLPYLFTSSTAKSLGELKSMKIKECKSIEEIISKEGEESDENVKIIFEQLQDLYLEKLDELRCFYAGNFTLSFPSLEEVHIIKCSSMKTFSAFNKIHNPWYYSEYARPQKVTHLNSALHRTSEEEVEPLSPTPILQ
ncbi:uncharacterized protein LOC114166327 [Vigna unguiculata]|uniref:uncharacterized protein LOC114166327 n=1 Tax=Vigna unguiculata TaxID=3917 RepID=UPI0010166F2A|nr:uncharacterized protein LOC114166327 [Vigna unguiculata]